MTLIPPGGYPRRTKIKQHRTTGDEIKTIYQIKVPGRISDNWSDWFDGMTISFEGGGDTPTISTLTGVVADQAALQGLLDRLYALGLALLSVERIEPARPDRFVKPVRSEWMALGTSPQRLC
jgi:hypothetical protein